MTKPSKETKRYSAAERKAYYIGIGAAIGLGRTQNIKRATSKMDEKEKRSFYNGFDETMLKKPRGYFNNNQKGR